MMKNCKRSKGDKPFAVLIVSDPYYEGYQFSMLMENIVSPDRTSLFADLGEVKPEDTSSIIKYLQDTYIWL